MMLESGRIRLVTSVDPQLSLILGVGELSFCNEFVVFYKIFICIFRLKSTRIEMDIRPLLTVDWYGPWYGW
jgi:hypothetical protein